MPKKTKWVVYRHLFADTKEVCYYGCGGESRAFDLYNREISHKKAVSTRGVIVEILHVCENKSEATTIEKEFIKVGIAKAEPLFNEDPSIKSERSRKTGYKVGKMFAEKGIGIAAPGIQSKAGKIGGAIAGRKTFELGTGVHGMSLEKRKELGKHLTHVMWKCLECGRIMSSGSLGLHQKSTKHFGKEKEFK